MFASLIAAAAIAGSIQLGGVSGRSLVAVSSFDANNVRLGDPMALSIDFSGDADFTDLHPPKIAKTVDPRVWKIDEASAKTDTREGGRIITYRVRPVKEGVHFFPDIAFSYSSPTGSYDLVAVARGMPVHVKAASQAALAFSGDAAETLPMPDGITLDPGCALDDDALFRWKKACRSLDASLFEEFGFPAGRMNEAALRTVAGEWARALSIYSSLEWRTGQTPSIERGIAAALSRKAGERAELPSWRQALRMVLRHSWKGRLAAVISAVAALAAFFWLTGRIARAAALFALAAAVPFASAFADDPFSRMEKMMEEHRRQMDALMNSNMMTMLPGELPDEDISVKASLAVVPEGEIETGAEFAFEVSLEVPEKVAVENLRFSVSENFGLSFPKGVQVLADGGRTSSSNVVKRFSIPARYDVPFRGSVSFSVSGMASVTRKIERRGMVSSFSSSRGFSVDTPPVEISVKPLPGENRPEGFAGIVGTGFRYTEKPDAVAVSTNDVVKTVCTLEYESGYVPEGVFDRETERKKGAVSWVSYFVADGAREIPPGSVAVYDAGKHAYEVLRARPHALSYVPDSSENAPSSVAVDSAVPAESGGTADLRLAPFSSSPVVKTVPASSLKGVSPLEESGVWARVELGDAAGWVEKERLE